MEQSPGHGLRISLFKVCKEGSVRQVLETGSVISHDVLVSWEEMGHVAVAVETLVVTGEAAEGCGRSGGGDGTFADSRHCRGVVAEVLDRSIGQGTQRAHGVDLG